ncbi:COR domain-containing protein [Streptomyces sp. NBC_01262]|uniref:COR domain-containing protein n=1 Tax=Streptomyces sp. NBC_01262 TaxID=2903803 RepID=UPI002E359A22|nr:COR domain-containing protein [Streptomyces sp. NBC_01262]
MDGLEERFRKARDTGDLDLSWMGFERIPEAVFLDRSLQKIRTLNLTGNSISSIAGDPIILLSSMEQLDLSKNRFGQFPHGLSSCRRLQVLRLDGNGLRNLEIQSPEDFISMRVLSASQNGMEELDSSIGKLANLEVLDLSDNLLLSLPSDLDRLTNLKELHLGGNPVFVPGEEVARLRSLRLLDMSRTNLTTLPQCLGNLPPDVQLQLDGNFFDENIEALLARGVPNLLAYLRTLDIQPHYEAKLILVGEGNVGKTSLVEALRGNPFVENRSTTHGIEINTFELPLSDQDLGRLFPGDENCTSITVRSWDFGGQEIYRVTHQFFFSQHALFLVTWRPREGQEANFVEEWIKRIKLRCGNDARVLLVSTYAGEGRQEEIDYSALRRKYGPLMAGNQRIDSKTSLGLPELSDKIVLTAAGLPRMGERISTDWRAVQDELLATHEAYVRRSTFDRICDRHGVNEAEAEALAALLNDLGYIVYYPDDDDLRNFIILQPEWLTRAISYVLEDAETRQNSGILLHSSLARIWGDPDTGYPQSIHPYFLRLMEKFDISYRVQEGEASLVAQLVPHERPDISWPGLGEADELVLLCDFSEEPTGLIPWLTVRSRRFSVQQWRKGFYLEDAQYDARALVESLSPTRLSVRVTGASRTFLFDIMRYTVEHLVSTRWPGLTSQLRIPCPGGKEHGTPCPASFKIENLERMRASSITSFRCVEGCLQEIDVNRLLVGLSSNASLDQQLILASKIDAIQADIVELAANERQYQQEVGTVLHALIVFTKAVNAEVTDCPKLFSLHKERRRKFDPRALLTSRITLNLWCEHPGSQHPVLPSYEYSASKNWLTDMAPYVNVVAMAVSALAPIVGGIAGVFDAAALKDSADLMKSLAESAHITTSGYEADTDGVNLSAAQGAGLRAFREFLFTIDKTKEFRGLRRVHSPTGDFLWICPHHFPLYEPPLPGLYSGGPPPAIEGP